MKKQTTKLSVTIGIPAHNEEGNITQVLKSILYQRGSHLQIDAIIVICDGCTDNTAALVKKMQQKHRIISLVDDGQRLGKAERLNYLHRHCHSDTLLIMDADVIFSSAKDLDKLCQAMLEHSEALIVGPRYHPYPTHTFAGQCAVYSYLSFEDSILQFNAGQNIFALMGCCTLIRASFARKVHYPVGTVSDQNFLYLTAYNQRANSFFLERSATVYFRTVSTLHDWWVLSARSVRGDREDAIARFGTWVRDMYTMPRSLFVHSLIKFLFKHPVYVTGSIILNILIRIFHYQHAFLKPGIWETALSSKVGMEAHI